MSVMSCLASGRGGSYNVTNPTRPGAPVSGPRATASVRYPLKADSLTRASKRLDRWGLKSTGLGDRSHGALHHAQSLPVLFDHGFRPPIFRIKRCERDRFDRRVRYRRRDALSPRRRNARSIGSWLAS